MGILRQRSGLAALSLIVASACTGGSSETDSTSSGTVSAATSESSSSSGSSSSSSGSSSSSSSGETTWASTSTDPTGSTGEVTTGSTSGSSSSSTGGFCEEGTIICEGGVAQTCDGMGGISEEQECGDEVCAEGLGCVLCVPGEGSCNGDVASYCNDDGDGYLEEICDPLQGLSCDGGHCAGACSEDTLGLSYIGCDYYPAVLPQNNGYNNAPKEEFAVSVSNTTAQMATVTITRGANVVTTVDVPANAVKAIPLPWINETTKSQGPSAVIPEGTYRLRSDQPVTVYQYNPIASTVTNDASLLLPVNAWTSNYMISAWSGGYYAVVASQEGTIVDLAPSPTTSPVLVGGGVDFDGNGQIPLEAGDILLVFAGGDVTGTIVSANKPIEAFGGHKCTQVPPGACDHLEEAMLPIEALAKEYLIAPTAQYPNGNLDKPQVIKIIAAEDATNLTYEPDQPQAKALNKGEFVQFPATTAHFKVTSDKKILVTQYMVGQSAMTGDSDPAFVQAIPTDQFRTSYLFHAPPSWTANYVDIIAPNGSAVEVDGAAVMNFKMIGASGYGVSHTLLDNGGDGNHSVTADDKVGISVYGLQNYGSYWYPGGTDLVVIPQ